MRKLTLILFILCVGHMTLAQELALKITNPAKQKEIIFKQNKRIKMWTSSGQLVKGRFSIADAQKVFVKDQEYALEDIVGMKRNPLLTSVFTTGFLIYGGALMTGFGALIGVLVDSNAYWLMAPGAAMIFTGLKSPNFNRKFSKDKGWTLEIVSLSP